MKIYDVFGKTGESGEHILGSRDTGSHACYLVHGVLKPGGKGRELSPGAGHEELVLVIAGDLQLSEDIPDRNRGTIDLKRAFRHGRIGFNI